MKNPPNKQNTKFVVENVQISEVGPKSSEKVSTTQVVLQVVEPEATQTVETQIEIAREDLLVLCLTEENVYSIGFSNVSNVLLENHKKLKAPFHFLYICHYY